MAPLVASGIMHLDHTSGRSISLGDVGFEITCPSCSFNYGKARREAKLYQESWDIVVKGVHVENGKEFEKPNIKPLSVAVPINNFGQIAGPSISIRSPAGSGFDILCCTCALNLGENPSIENINIIMQGKHVGHAALPAKDDDTKKDKSGTTTDKEDATKEEKKEEAEASGKKTKAVIGNVGVAGIKIKGGKINLKIEAPDLTNPAKSGTPVAPTNADELVANNIGVAGIDLEGKEDVEFTIGKAITGGAPKQGAN